MKDEETRGPNVWLKGYLNIGYSVGSIKRFQIAQILDYERNNCPEQCHPISLSHIQLQCEKDNHFIPHGGIPIKECKEREEIFSSCLIDVFHPFAKGVPRVFYTFAGMFQWLRTG